jgi:hypothetical protein
VIGEVCFTDSKVRAIISSIELLIDACIPSSGNKKYELKQAIGHYREAIDILRLKSEFTTGEFQKKKKHFEIELAANGEEVPVWTARRSTHSSSEQQKCQEHIDSFFRLWV